MNTMCAVPRANHLRAVADVFRPFISATEQLRCELHFCEVHISDVFRPFISATEQLRCELHKSEVLLIASTLLVSLW